MRTITNDYRDARIMNLGSGSERRTYLVTQTGVAPRAERPRTHKCSFSVRMDAGSISTPTRAREAGSTG